MDPSRKMIAIVAVAVIAIVIVMMLRKNAKKEKFVTDAENLSGSMYSVNADVVLGQQPTVGAAVLASMPPMPSMAMAQMGSQPMMNGQLLNAPSANVAGYTRSGVGYTPDTNNEELFDPLTTETYQTLGDRAMMMAPSAPFSRQQNNPFIGQLPGK